SGRLTRRDACEEWLRGYLADGPKTVKDCERAATVAGVSQPLVDRARAALFVRSVRLGFGKGSCCYISLPDAGHEAPERPEPAADDHTPPYPAYPAPNPRGE